jgi:hypothetical protein
MSKEEIKKLKEASDKLFKETGTAPNLVNVAGLEVLEKIYKKKKTITEKLFEKIGDKTYKCLSAYILYDQGVPGKKLAVTKWTFVLKCKEKGISVIELDEPCGYCFDFKTCADCALSFYGTGDCCRGVIRNNSDNITLKDIERVLKFVEQGSIEEK